MIRAAGVGRPLAGLIAAAACGLLAGAGCGPAGPEGVGRPQLPDRPGTASGTNADLAARFGTGRWIDLTHAFNAETIYWPTEKGFVLEREFAGRNPRGYYYAANRIVTAEHGGTHLDAPRHFAEGARTADQIDVARLVGPAVVVDVTRQCAADPIYEVGPSDLVAWERSHGRQLVDVIVLLRTGWGAKWPDREAYLGTAATGPEAVARLRFPGLAPAAAQWLVDHRRIRAIGIDTASIDHGPSTHFGAHVALCTAEVPVFENVADLAALPATGAFVAALPMKIAGGSGGPLRIVARLPDSDGGR